MAKKRFTEGLNSLFGNDDKYPKATLSLFPEATTGTAHRDEEKKSSKGFASQLDAFLAEAFESADNQEREAAANANSKAPRRLVGLDLLIQQTTDSPPGNRPKVSDKRRLTLAFDKEQLAKLKAIADEEGIYLKDLINQLIDRYLQKQQKNNPGHAR